MNERIARMELASGDVSIIPLDEAVSELSGSGLYFEIAARLRQGEAVRAPGGISYRALAALGQHAYDQLPPGAAS